MPARLALALSVAVAGLTLAATPVLAGDAAPDGATVFHRCAACHTASGAGVPGAFPPLQSDFRALASGAAGRRYIALAVIKGLNGPITVEGKPYRGVMPAQSGLDDAAIAAVLNHVGTKIAKSGPPFRAFTAAEVAVARASGSTLSSADVSRLHEGAGGK
ncbi:MAG: cytochrome c [Sphingomonadales bacterium]|nr:cytochrome c [Sphingomonadales bacterium]MDE2568812.1 cytochrome c [Sphingomonadales bacterium]